MKAKFGPLEKNNLKMIDINRDYIFRTAAYTLFYHKMNEGILEEMKVEPV
jgi:hypothetical protein